MAIDPEKNPNEYKLVKEAQDKSKEFIEKTKREQELVDTFETLTRMARRTKGKIPQELINKLFKLDKNENEE